MHIDCNEDEISDDNKNKKCKGKHNNKVKTITLSRLERVPILE